MTMTMTADYHQHQDQQEPWQAQWSSWGLSCSLFIGMIIIIIVFYLFQPAIVAARGPPASSLSERPELIVISSSPSTTKSDASDHSTASKGGGGGGGEGGGVIGSAAAAAPPAVGAGIALSIIIPAYNEQERLPAMLQEAYAYFCCPTTKASEEMASSSLSSDDHVVVVSSVEWILVNDGSIDDTTEVYRRFALATTNSGSSSSTSTSSDQPPSATSRVRNMTWQVITFATNRGKGAAVQAGMLAATGDYLLMVDADGATQFGTGLEALLRVLLALPSSSQQQQDEEVEGENGVDVVFGSRATLSTAVERSVLRRLLQFIFHLCVVIFVGCRHIEDTQCGFKLFKREAARHIFTILHLRRWAFDTEMLYLAVQLQYIVREVPVTWHEVDGSKLHTTLYHLAYESIGMLRDMVCVRLCYTLRLWTIIPQPVPPQQQQRPKVE
jgi:dolichyl-phosphate beta-glucosyltransferase